MGLLLVAQAFVREVTHILGTAVRFFVDGLEQKFLIALAIAIFHETTFVLLAGDLKDIVDVLERLFMFKVVFAVLLAS